MNKEIIQAGDILEQRNGQKIIYSQNMKWILEKYYDEDLNCIHGDRFDIVKIYRPLYELIADKDNDLQR